MEDLIEQIGVDVLPSQRGDVYRMLFKVLGNITDKPSEPKFRTLKKDNKKISETLLKHPSAVSILMAAGFEDQGETLHCPDTADLEAMGEAVALLECVIASCEGEEQPAPAAAPAQPARGAPLPTAATAKAEKTNPSGFARRRDDEKERQQAADQLAALRAGRAQAGAAAAQPPQPEGAADGTKKPIKSAFDFENRRAKEEQRNQAAESLEDLRRRQKEKFKEFQSDPNAREADVYKQPASVAGNGKAEQSWGDWLGGMFGGSSSGSGGGGGSRPSNDRPGPRVKGIGDLPKPVQRG